MTTEEAAHAALAEQVARSQEAARAAQQAAEHAEWLRQAAEAQRR
ncbi:hypothetical protein [Streptomyces flavidovirens]